MSVEDFLQQHVPIAEPCWDPQDDDEEEEEEPQKKYLFANQRSIVLESHKNVGTGMAWIQYLANNTTTKTRKHRISQGAQSILQDLLSKQKEDNQKKNCSNSNSDHYNNDDSFDSNIMTEHLIGNGIIPRDDSDDDEWKEYDCEVMETKKLTESAKQGKVSLFCTILRLFSKEEKAIISTKSILSTCTMSMRPADIPPDMTSRQMVLTALQFLTTPISTLSSSSTTTAQQEALEKSIFPFMPILSFVTSSSDDTKTEDINIEDASFQKNITSGNGDWTIVNNNSFRRKVLVLEKAFLSSTMKHMNRIHMCPRSDDKSKELSLICRGYTSKGDVGKKATTGTKRKSSSDTASSPKTNKSAKK